MSTYVPRKILVTGSSGLIGSAITKYASSQNIDVLAHSRTNNLDFDNFQKMKKIYFDLKDSNEICFDANIDTVIHTATSNENKLASVEIALQNTLVGTLNLLNKCVAQKVQKFVYVSTVQLYTPKDGFINEFDEIEFKSIYTKQHYLTEQLLRTYADKFEQGINVLRVANVFSDSPYALSNRSNLVPTCFIKSGFDLNKISLLTNGAQKKNFIFDADVGKISIITLPSEEMTFRIINVASMYTPTIIEIAKMVQQEFLLLDRRIEIEIEKDVFIDSKSLNFVSNFYEMPTWQRQQELMRESIKKLIELQIGQKI
jgi:nucleoside-diphosphate-sugar epimerase